MIGGIKYVGFYICNRLQFFGETASDGNPAWGVADAHYENDQFTGGKRDCYVFAFLSAYATPKDAKDRFLHVPRCQYWNNNWKWIFETFFESPQTISHLYC